MWVSPNKLKFVATSAIVLTSGLVGGGALPASAAPGSAAVDGPTPQPREAAGKYVTNCIQASGTSYIWTKKNPRTCAGWLDIYVGGNRVGHVNEAAVQAMAHPTVKCVIEGSMAVLELAFGSETVIGWVFIASTLTFAGMDCAN
jgi:hypothetical protein